MATTALARRIEAAQQQLCAIYRLELPLHARDFVLSAEAARALRPGWRPRTGLFALQERGSLWLGLYFERHDAADPAAVFEETSHWLAVAWHAAQARPISALVLELQADVDRYAVARTQRARDPLRHFARLRLRAGLTREQRLRYRAAHAAAFRYCRSLERRFPGRCDLPDLVRELRGFYRRPLDRKLALTFASIS